MHNAASVETLNPGRSHSSSIANSLRNGTRSVLNALKPSSRLMGLVAGGLAAIGVTQELKAEIVTLRDPIGGSEETTRDSRGNGSLQTPSPVPAGVNVAPSPAQSVISVDLPPNSICRLQNISFVFGCKSLIATPGMDLYDYRQVFNSTAAFKFSVSSGTVESLGGRYTGDIHNETLTPEKFSNVTPWTTTTNNPYGTAAMPLYYGTIALSEVPAIETGAEGMRVFIKVFTERVENSGNKTTKFLMFYAKNDTTYQDAWVNFSNAGYIEAETTTANSTSFAAKVVADIQPKIVVTPPPACGIERIDGKLAVCWPEDKGTNFSVVVGETLSGPWNKVTDSPVITRDGKNFVIIPTNTPTGYFRLSAD